MSKLTSIPRVSRDDLQGAPEWMDQYLQVANEFQEQATNRLNKDLVVAKFFDLELTHGEEKPIKNPFDQTIPNGVSHVACQGVEVDSSGKPTGKLYPLGVARLDWRVIQTRPGQPQRLGITAHYDLEHSEPCLIKTKSGNQSINNNTETALTGFDTTTYSRGSVITDNGSVFTVSEAGTYQVHLQLQWAGGGVTYSALETYLNVTGGSAYYLNTFSPVTYGNAPSTVVSGVVRLAAGGSFTPYGYQTNAATAARNVTGGTDGTRIMIHRLHNDSTPRARVRLRFDKEA
jgi:hypothetical protein